MTQSISVWIVLVRRLIIYTMQVVTFAIPVTTCLAQQSLQSQHDVTAEIAELKTSFDEFKKSSIQVSEALANLSRTVIPVGSIVGYAGPIDGLQGLKEWRLCNGDIVSADEYPILWARLQTTWGGTGQEAFKLPDLSGVFLRGVDGPAHKDPGPRNPKTALVGSTEQDAIQDHKHLEEGHSHTLPWGGQQIFGSGSAVATVTTFGLDQPQGAPVTSGKAVITGATSLDASHQVRVSDETRPQNVAVYWIIRVK